MNGLSIASAISTLSGPGVLHSDPDVVEDHRKDAEQLNALDPASVRHAIREFASSDAERDTYQRRLAKRLTKKA